MKSHQPLNSFERRVEEYRRIFSSRGLTQKNFDGLCARDATLSPWSHDPILSNLEVLVAEALSTDPSTIGAVYHYLLWRELASVLECVQKGENPLPHPYSLSTADCELLSKAHERLAPQLPEKLADTMQDIRSESYDRGSLLSDLAHPFVTKGTFRAFFNEVCGENIYFSYDEISPAPYVGERDYSWQNISSEPQDIVRYLRENPPCEGTRILDLGCGSGGALFPFALLSQGLCEGVEIELQWCQLAERVSQRIGRPDIKVHHQDLLQFDCSGRDIYYIYSPFREGRLLTTFVNRLSAQLTERAEILAAAYPPLVKCLEEATPFRVIAQYGELCRLTYTR